MKRKSTKKIPSRKHFSKRVIGALLASTAIIGSMLLIYREQGKRVQKYEKLTVVASPTISPFQTYKNTIQGFTLSYPSNWRVFADNEDLFYIGSTTEVGELFKIEYNIHSPFGIEINKDWLVQIESHKNYYLNSTSFADIESEQLQKQPLTINDKQAIKYLVRSLHADGPGPTFAWIYILKDKEHIFRITMNSNNEKEEEILSSLKFIF